jgi:hypothetical protein
LQAGPVSLALASVALLFSIILVWNESTSAILSNASGLSVIGALVCGITSLSTPDQDRFPAIMALVLVGIWLFVAMVSMLFTFDPG